MYSHFDLTLEKNLNKVVSILFFDGTSEIGLLSHSPISSLPYMLRCQSFDFLFCKSHVKKVIFLEGLC